MKRILMIGGAGVLALACALGYWLWEPAGLPAGDEAEVEAVGADGRRPARARPVKDGAPAGRPASATRAKTAARRPPRVLSDEVLDDPDHPYSAQDKAVAKDLEDQLDVYEEVETIMEKLADLDLSDRRVLAKLTPEERKAVESRARFMAAVKKACSSPNPSVRSRGVAALSWVGGDVLPQLTPLMADPDPEVAEEAIDAVEQALDEQEDPGLRFEAAAAYMANMSNNEDAMTMLSGTLTSAALEIIDPTGDSAAAEQKALDNRNLVVDTLATLIESENPKLTEAAMEAFNDITSEDWVSRQEAEKWAADPDNYESPES